MRKLLLWLFPLAAVSVACFWPMKDLQAARAELAGANDRIDWLERQLRWQREIYCTSRGA